MDIIKSLNLNKHPKDCENLSLIDAQGIRVSDDMSCLQNEESISSIDSIYNTISTAYNQVNFEIIHVIAGNKELVIITAKSEDIYYHTYSAEEPLSSKGQHQTIATKIFRYFEETGNTIIANHNYVYNGGKLSGTYTYNVEGSLIIAIAEDCSSTGGQIPLKTINLGKSNGISIDTTIPNDNSKSDSTYSLIPEVTIPSINNVDYVKGMAYKGWNYLFIRFKINETDYTQWYNFGFPIYVDSIEKQNIIKYCYGDSPISDLIHQYYFTGVGSSFMYANTGKEHLIPQFDIKNSGYCSGCSDNFSTDLDIANVTFSTIFSNTITQTFQIGILTISKSYTKAYITSDLNNISNYIYNLNNLTEYNSSDLLKVYYNYYNVKHIINYNNRLYITNYNEKDINNNYQTYADNVNLRLCQNKYNFTKEHHQIIHLVEGDIYDVDKTNQQEKTVNSYKDTVIDNNHCISLADYYNINENTNISIFVNDSKIYEGYANTLFISAELNYSVTIKRCRYYIGTEDEQINYFSEDTMPNLTYLHKLVNGQLVKLNNNRDTIFTISWDNYTKTFVQKRYYIIIGNDITNSDVNFKEKFKHTTLIPDGVYNFYIHYVDKYGHATNGYKLTNKYKILDNGIGQYNIDSECSIIEYVYNNTKYYLFFTKDKKIADISRDNLFNIYSKLSIDNYIIKGSNQIGSSPLRTNIINAFCAEYYGLIHDTTINNNLIYDLFNSGICNNTQLTFGHYTNSKGADLFKIPNVKESEYIYFTLSADTVKIPDGYVGWFISYEKYETNKKQMGLLLQDDFKINPNISATCTIGESIKINTSENTDSMYFYSDDLDIANSIKSDFNILSITGIFTSSNPIGFKFIPSKGLNYPVDLNNTHPFEAIPNTACDTILEGKTKYNKYYPIPKYKLAAADDISANRSGLGTAIKLENSYNLFNIIRKTNNKLYGDFSEQGYTAELINLNADLYINDNKTLIRLGNIIYTSDKANIEYGFNGFLNIGSVLVYNKNQIYYDTASQTILDTAGNPYYGVGRNNYLMPTNIFKSLIADPYEHNEDEDDKSVNETTICFYDTNSYLSKNFYKKYITNNYFIYDRAFVNLMIYPKYDNIYHESKSFNNAPKVEIYPIKIFKSIMTDTFPGEDDSMDKGAFINDTPTVRGSAQGCIVTPANSIDLFQNRQYSLDDCCPVVYSNYRSDLVNTTSFNKTLRRSNIIQDESRENNWRRFEVENYKYIDENKGNITNIVGLGLYLLVHTEHSLFMFDRTSGLGTDEKDIKLTQPDAFDLNYQEIFTSEHGFGGLTSSDNAIYDTFGYVFWCSANKHIYRFDGKQINIIDDKIYNWINKYNPINIIFANDKRRHRLLIKIQFTASIYDVISYNYNANSFISTHNYTFDKSFNTENELYLFSEKQLNSTYLNNFTYDKLYKFINTTYGIIPSRIINTNKHSASNTVNNSYISIIFNSAYDEIKLIEFIRYKLRKIESVASAIVHFPVEECNATYSGDKLRIYNDKCDTNDINIAITSLNAYNAYTLPYFELGNWNFNYIINAKNTDITRVYGNYFILKFEFDNTLTDSVNKLIEFESLDVVSSKQRR